MRRCFSRLAGLASCLTLAMSVESFAQQATSFEQLQVLVKRGDKVYITDSNGKTTEERIESLSNSLLRVTRKGVGRDLTQADVFEIRQWRGDSVKNGAVAGLATGLGFGALIFLDQECTCTGEKLGVMAIWGGIGAGIGVGIDALIPHKKTIFSNTQTARKLSFKPIVSRTSKGGSVSLRF